MPGSNLKAMSVSLLKLVCVYLLGTGRKMSSMDLWLPRIYIGAGAKQSNGKHRAMPLREAQPRVRGKRRCWWSVPGAKSETCLI